MAHVRRSNRTIDSLVNALDVIDKAIMVVAQVLLAAMVLITFISVLGRTFFHHSVPDDLIMQEMLMVAIVFLPLGYVQSIGAHLEVTVLTDRMPRPIQDALIFFGLLLSIAIFGVMAYLSWNDAYDAYITGQLNFSSIMDIPEWPAKMIVPVGFAWWCLRMVAQLVVLLCTPATD